MLYGIVYHTKNCQKCKLTAMRLAPMNIEQVLIGRDVEGSEDIINYMDEQGLTSAPLVRIYRDDELVAEWTNFNIKEINKWRTKAVEENAKD